MPDAGIRRVVPLTFGWEDLPQTISIYGGDPSIRLREPVPGVLLQLDGGWLLLDTGFNVPLVRDPPLRERFHGRNHGIYAELLDDPRDSLEVAFETVGVDPADVVVVALSHLHNDHAGGLRWFVERVPVHLQRRDLEYGLHGGRPGDGPEQHGFIRIDYDDPDIDWQLADGEVEVVPGVRAIPTYGHTPGHQSFVVTLDPAAVETYGAAGFVLAFDAADLQRNIDEELAVGGFVDCPPEQTVEAIRRLKAMAAEKGFRLVPGHDPEVWPAFTKEMGVPGP
jgi:glyoxylase-like metal-dependent hydrolase (beta-lactamase superfamily II)